MRRRQVAAVAMSAALALGLAACGGGGGTDDTTPDGVTAEFDAAVGKVFNPSDKKGGTLRFGITEFWDSVDPGDTYYGLSWNLVRLYGRSLLMFKPAPGEASEELVGDLAEGKGVVSNGGRTWTYKLREGIKFEDGTPVTSRDIKYAVLRTIDKETLVNGPTYFGDVLDLKGHRGAFKDKGKETDAIQTPDDRTVVFNLKQPYGEFDYLAMLPGTIPVPEAKDTGTRYKDHVVSTGPYMFESYQEGKSFTLVRNPNWDQATDPNRRALPDRYEVTLGINGDDLDNQIISGSMHVDLAGTGVQPASLARVLNDPALRARADNPSAARLWYTSINPQVAPFDNIECRKAVMFAVDKTSYQAAFGGEFAGGEIATNIMPRQIPGFQQTNLFPPGADNKGDLDKARAALTACGQPDGFETNIAFRSDRPKERAVSESLQQSLARVGIRLTLKGYPTSDYFSLYAGKPSFRNDNKLGLLANGWASDFNTGNGFLTQIVDGRVIRESGGSSNLSVNIPQVNQMIDQAIAQTDPAQAQALWAAIDRRVMEEAVILPGVWAKALTMRGQGLTNVFVNDAFGQYDYMAMGVA